MAITVAKGYDKARADIEKRKANGLAWNPETRTYEKSDAPVVDKFMRARARMMRRMAITLRPALLPAKVFAPNRAARQKADEARRLYDHVLGPASPTDRMKATTLLACASVESARIAKGRLFGQRYLARQPYCRRVEYHQ